MDLSTFEKSPEVVPLLVRLYEGHRLYNLAKNKSPAARGELAEVVADLLGLDLTIREQELLADVLIALMRQAERDLRQALSDRLCALDNVPLRLALQFANDDIQVAEPMLRHSPVLSDLDLVYIIKSKGPDYWKAIADRDHLSPQVIDILADTRDTGTFFILSVNDRIKLTSYAVNILAESAKANEDLARPLLERDDLPESIIRALYDHVGENLKEFIRTMHGIENRVVQNAVDDILLEFSTNEIQFMPTAQMIVAAEKYQQSGFLNLNLMMETLNRGQIASFIAMFARYSNIPAARIHGFLKESCPKGMAVACKAFRIQKSDFSRIYLLTQRLRSSTRLINHKDMLEVLAYFDRIKPDTALRIVQKFSA